jgi:hypothetical protein
MDVEKPIVIALLDRYRLQPQNNTYSVIPHVVNLDKPFTNELGKVSEIIENTLKTGRSVSLLGIKDTGILAVASFMEQPDISEVVTLWSAFRGGFTPFEREGIMWLHESHNNLTPLLNKITTVYTQNGFANFPDTLPGARVVKVNYRDKKVRTWRDGLNRLLDQPIDIFFNTRQSGS